MECIVSYKEEGVPTWQYIRYKGMKTREQIIKFFGLDQPNIEEYKIVEGD